MLDAVTVPSASQGIAAPRGVTGPAPAASASSTGVAQAEPQDFASIIGEMAKDAIAILKTGEATAISGVRGGATVQQVVEAVMAAEETLQAGISIRDKVVSAYLEISRMSI
jgi:flagellar hook-basal body complex protein FliE